MNKGRPERIRIGTTQSEKGRQESQDDEKRIGSSRSDLSILRSWGAKNSNKWSARKLAVRGVFWAIRKPWKAQGAGLLKGRVSFAMVPTGQGWAEKYQRIQKVPDDVVYFAQPAKETGDYSKPACEAVEGGYRFQKILAIMRMGISSGDPTKKVPSRDFFLALPAAAGLELKSPRVGGKF